MVSSLCCFDSLWILFPLSSLMMIVIAFFMRVSSWVVCCRDTNYDLTSAVVFPSNVFSSLRENLLSEVQESTTEYSSRTTRRATRKFPFFLKEDNLWLLLQPSVAKIYWRSKATEVLPKMRQDKVWGDDQLRRREVQQDFLWQKSVCFLCRLFGRRNLLDTQGKGCIETLERMGKLLSLFFTHRFFKRT